MVLRSSGLSDAEVAVRSKTNKRAQAHSDRAPQRVEMLIGTEVKKPVHNRKKKVSGFTRRDDSVVTESKESYLEVKNQLNSVSLI